MDTTLTYQQELTENQKAIIASANPVGLRVMVRRYDKAEKTRGGLIVPQTSYDKNIFCEVVAKGRGIKAPNGRQIDSTAAKPGDAVIIRQFEDKHPVHLQIKDHFIVWGQVIEGIRRIGSWLNGSKSALSSVPHLTELPQSLRDHYAGKEKYEYIEPLMDWIVVYKDPAVEKTAGGLYIPEVSQDLPIIGTLMAVGPGRYDIPTGRWQGTEVQPGERIVFSPYAGYEVTLDGIKFQLMQEKDISAIYTGTGKVEASDSMLSSINGLQVST